jgi:hypothetical protein
MSKTVCVAVLLTLVPTLGWSQTLAEIAEKEKQRRKQAEQSGAKTHVITDDELKANKGRLANDPNAAPSPAATAKDKEPQAQKQPAGTDRREQEASWRARAATARQQLEETTKDYEDLNSQYLAQGEYFVDENGKKVIATPEELQRLVANAKAAMVAAQKRWENLEEEARRARVPPGWLR